MLKKITALMLTLIIIVSGVIYSTPLPTAAEPAESSGNEFSWARDGVDYCVSHGIMSGDEYGNLNLGSNITRAQMAKMLVEAFNLPDAAQTSFADAGEQDWSYPYVCAIEEYMPSKSGAFNGGENVTREEFAATLVRASGLNSGSVRNPGILSRHFSDAGDVSEVYRTLLTIAVERAYIKGSDGLIRPRDLMTRAEVAVLVYRAAANNTGEITLTWEDLGIDKSYTPITGDAQITVEQAQKWAADRGAAQRFIDIAPVYWEYGRQFGIRPEIMYAQAGKETGYGNYGGAVKPEMNNWAGIKIKSPIGDRTEDHETFATPEDGVRAHYNHMCAYIGIAPIGEPHDRYYVVKSIDWAGSIKNVEALGGRWCPDLYYGYSIIYDCLAPMSEY